MFLKFSRFSSALILMVGSICAESERNTVILLKKMLFCSFPLVFSVFLDFWCRRPISNSEDLQVVGPGVFSGSGLH